MPCFSRIPFLSTIALTLALSACHSAVAVIEQSGDGAAKRTRATIVGGTAKHLVVALPDGNTEHIDRDEIVSIQHPGERGTLVGGLFAIGGAAFLVAGAFFWGGQPLDDEYNNFFFGTPLLLIGSVGFGIGLPMFIINKGREGDSIERMESQAASQELVLQFKSQF